MSSAATSFSFVSTRHSKDHEMAADQYALSADHFFQRTESLPP